ncbi:hypothetical protein [Selenomonas sp. AE3005]|uniref:hypothetical protein n=1 Tax=Selenomonas sp. AE3005 TaxID=1485543 RepID=UPI0004829478|nr:hypothetical protein [Selenomonas sp. AE3005]
MDNVYSLVKHFYEENDYAAQILPRDAVEAYLRRNAWHGAEDEDLKRIWSIISVMISAVNDFELYSFATLTAYDYQEIFYRYAEVRPDFMLAEQDINDFLSTLTDFYAYLIRTRHTEDFQIGLEAAREALYEGGYFFLPDRRDGDEFYRSLEHMEEVSYDTMQKLNNLLDSLLRQISIYYQKPHFKRDMDRAILMYAGPEYDGQSSLNAEERHSFWLGFWDFFLFDYHLIDSDALPLRYYYEYERSNLSTTEQDILRDLLRSRFTVFTIDDVGADFLTCRNFFTDEVFELPVPELAMGNYSTCVMFGHIHSHGVMLLNYITSITASKRLQTRMRDVVLRQYELFKLQNSQAELKDFFARNAGVVRHTLQIMSSYAQLNVIPIRTVSPAIEVPESVSVEFAEDEDMLRRVAKHVGFSKFEITLLVKLFEDYVLVAGLKTGDDILITAILLKFAQLNGIDISGGSEIYELLGIDSASVKDCMEKVHGKLGCVPYDPRYLTEEAFIKSLFF